jgi:Na+/proline symporter
MNTDPARFLRLSRWMTLAWGAVLLCFGMVRWGPLLKAGLTVASISFGSLLGLFLLGTFDRRSTANGALAGMFSGLAATLSLYFFTHVAFTWYVLVGAVVTCAVGAAASRLASAGENSFPGDGNA